MAHFHCQCVDKAFATWYQHRFYIEENQLVVASVREYQMIQTTGRKHCTFDYTKVLFDIFEIFCNDFRVSYWVRVILKHNIIHINIYFTFKL